MKEEHHVKIEKGTLLGAAMVLITMGVERTTTGGFDQGIIMICLGMFIMFAREHFKFHRWSDGNSFWKGKQEKEYSGGL